MLNKARLQEFAARLQGRLLRPSDAEYDDARKIWNAMINRRPVPRFLGRSTLISVT